MPTELKINFPNCNVFTGSINSFYDNNKEQYDLSLIKTVLIHINPDQLENTYKAIYESSKKYISFIHFMQNIVVRYRFFKFIFAIFYSWVIPFK